MTARNDFGFQSFSCNGSAAAASFDARIHSLLGTAGYPVVSLCALGLDVRVILPSA